MNEVAYLQELIREASGERLTPTGLRIRADGRHLVRPTTILKSSCAFALRAFGQYSEHYQGLRRLERLVSWTMSAEIELGALLVAMLDELKVFGPRITDGAEPTSLVPQGEVQPAPSRVTPSDWVFVVHGHDEPNLLKVERLLRDRWHLTPMVLRDKPGKGRTLIEKLEQEAQKVGYAFALLSPDDLVQMQPDTQYFQARPNVLFELGWFFGRLGRARVCILFKKGTEIPSDLDGIMRVEFSESVEEKIIEIEAELEAAGLLHKS